MHGRARKSYPYIFRRLYAIHIKNYASWKEVQHEYYKKYITNLEPMTCEEIIHFFEMDFGDEEHWPFSKKRIVEFF